MDDQERWELFKESKNRCAYCGAPLIWKHYEVRGLQGAWVIDDPSQAPPDGVTRVQHASAEDGPAPCCYRCIDHPTKLSRRFTSSLRQSRK
jgi:hypothetical protein